MTPQEFSNEVFKAYKETGFVPYTASYYAKVENETWACAIGVIYHHNSLRGAHISSVSKLFGLTYNKVDSFENGFMELNLSLKDELEWYEAGRSLWESLKDKIQLNP